MAFKFHPDQSLPDNLRRLFQGRLTRVTTTLASPPEGDLFAAVHGVRKDLKRLRALLRLARPMLPRRVFDAEHAVLREAGRALSAARDAQVLQETFARLTDAEKNGAPTPGGGLTEGTIARLGEELAINHGALQTREELIARATGVRADLANLAARVPDWPLTAGGGWRATVGAGLAMTYRRGRRDLRTLTRSPRGAGGPAPGDEAWHDLRKRVKDLGYQLRPLRPVWPPMLKTLIRESDALAEALGEDHDLLILRAHVLGREQPWAEPGESAAFAARVDARRLQLQTIAQVRAARLYEAEKPAAFAHRLGRLWRRWRRERAASPRGQNATQ